METNGVTKNDLLSWVQKSIQNENFTSYDVVLQGKGEIGDGYMGDIVFLKVTGTTKENAEKCLNLVIKHGKPFNDMREAMPVKQIFETEIHFYNAVIPAFASLQAERKVKKVFNSVPKCYKTLIFNKMEVLVLENLKCIDYELYDKMKPMNLEHQKKVLKEYGRFHALSFAVRDQKPTEFSALSNRPCVAKELYKHKHLRCIFQKGIDEAVTILEERGDFSLIEKLKKILAKDAGEMVYDFLCEDIEKSQLVITHGDCWNNNFMFKYENNDRTSPSNVMILDWQVSTLRSPVFDLSHFIYMTSSKEQLDKCGELIQVYYTSFSNFLRELGSDPEMLFPYSTLKDHWRKYSLYGLIVTPVMLKFTLSDKEQTPGLENIKEKDDFAKLTDIGIRNKELYYSRLKPVLCHYFDFEFNDE